MTFSSTLRWLFALALISASSWAIAQKAPVPTRARGTIESVDGDLITVKSRTGEDIKLHMTDDIKVVGIIKISMADIKVGSFIGATTVSGPDGKQNAVEVHVTAPEGVAAGLALVGRVGSGRDGRTVKSIDYRESGGELVARLPDPSRFKRITAVVVNADTQTKGFDPVEEAWDYTGNDEPFAISGEVVG